LKKKPQGKFFVQSYCEASGAYTIPQALQNYKPVPQNEIGLKINKNKKKYIMAFNFSLAF